MCLLTSKKKKIAMLALKIYNGIEKDFALFTMLVSEYGRRPLVINNFSLQPVFISTVKRMDDNGLFHKVVFASNYAIIQMH